MIRKLFLPLLLSVALLLSACGSTTTANTATTSASGTSGTFDTSDTSDTTASDSTSGSTGTVTVEAAYAEDPVTTDLDTESMFTRRDLENEWDASEAVEITLSGTSASCDSDAVTIDGTTVTITAEGVYVLSGTLTDGMIIVDADSTEKVQLVLNGVDITSETSAAIYVLQADKVFITTAEGTENTLSNGGEYVAIDDNNIDAVIFSKDDITLNGSGTLIINAEEGHGVVSKDDLKVTGGTLIIDAACHGLSGKDSVRICGGTITITSDRDGIHSSNDEDDTKGYVYISDGNITIEATADGISAGTILQIEGGIINITTCSGSSNSSNAQVYNWSYSRGSSYTSTEEESCKGIKAGTYLVVNGGTFTIDAADDALHTNGDLYIAGGSFEIASGDDGVHADDAVVISGGTINITECYEGIEGTTIDITGGNISLVASDDGINSSGGTDSSGFGGWGNDRFSSSSSTTSYIRITGGVIYINAAGDGVDSNGYLYVDGGELYVDGPTSSADGAIDYESGGIITGGTVVAVGASGMAENFSSSSTQGSIKLTVSGSAGSEITLSDSSGNTLVSFTSAKSFSSVVISCPDLTVGENYTISVAGTEYTITLSSLIYSASTSSGGMGGSMGGNRR